MRSLIDDQESNRRMRFYLKWLAIAYLTVTSSTFSKEKDLTILYTSNTQGELRPCGCGKEQLGGLARRATAVFRERIGNGPIILLDAGDTFFVSRDLPSHIFKEAKVDAGKIATVYRYLKYDAVLAGEIDSLLGDLDRGDLSWIGTPERPFSVIEKDGWKVAVFGYLSPKLADREEIEKDLRLSLLVKDVREVRPKVDLVILLLHALERETSLILKKAKGVDLVISGHVGRLLQDAQVKQGVLIFEAENRGKYLGKITIHLSNEKMSPKNQVHRLKIKEDLHFVTSELEPHRKKTGGLSWTDVYPGYPKLVQELKNLEWREDKIKGDLLKWGSEPKSWYAHELIKLGNGFEDDPNIQRILK